jgi:hypothetical protein
MTTEKRISGKWVQRVPPKLHKALVEEAKAEGISLNTYVIYAMARGLGFKEGYVQGKTDGAQDGLELQRLFDLQQTRMKKATKAWRKANPGNDLVSPDLGKLLDWLLEKKK